MWSYGLNYIEATVEMSFHLKPQWYESDVVVRKHLAITSCELFDRAVDIMQIRHKWTVHLYPHSTI